MKKYLIMALGAALLFPSCEKEKLNNTDIEIPQEESQAPVEGLTVDNNGIIYTQINQELAYNKFITIDADKNGKNDFYFTSVLIYHDNQSHLYLVASPVSSAGGKLLLDNREDLVMNGWWCLPLDAGKEINATAAADQAWSTYMIKGVALDVLDHGAQGKTVNGPWTGKADKYLAMQVRINGQIHFGWVRISHSANEARMVITGYAYNVTPGQMIKAGQTLK